MAAKPRTLLLSCSLASFVACTMASICATAQPAPLPTDPQQIVSALGADADIAAALSDGSMTADECALHEGRLQCSCLRGPNIAFETWQAGLVGGLAFTQMAGVQLVTSREAVWVDGGWILHDMRLVFPEVVLEVSEAHIAGATVEMTGLRWRARGATPSLGCPTEVEMGAVRATARTARFEGGRWTLHGYRVGPWPIVAARSAHRAAPGFLPPTLRVTPQAQEAEASALVWNGLFVFAGGARNGPASAGVGLVSQRRKMARSLDVGGTYGEAQGFAALVSGDVALGEQTHVRGHVEHPSPDRSWQLRRFETGGFFRDWRSTRLGVAASGPAHALQLAGAVTTEPGLPDPTWNGLLSYGTVIDGGRFAQWSVDLEHVSERTEATRHSATAAVGLTVPLGWAQRAWIRPGLDVVANYGTVTVNRGIDASTTLSVLAAAEAGLAFEGRFARGRHRLSPVVRVGGEIAGIQQRQAREGAPPFLYGRPDRWRWGMAALEQSLSQGDFTLELPVGVFADAVGSETMADGIHDFGAFVRSSAVLEHGRVDLAASCAGGCDRTGFFAGAHLRPWQRLAVSYTVSDMTEHDEMMLFSDRLSSRGFTAIRLLDSDPAETPAFAQTAALRAHAGRGFVEVDGRYGAARQARGVGARVGWRWSELGWGLGVGGAWAPLTEDWAITAGLSLGR